MSVNGWPEYAKHVLAELKRHDKWLGSIDVRVDNHINHIEHRLTEIESHLKTRKWIEGILFTLVIGIFSMVFSQLIL